MAENHQSEFTYYAFISYKREDEKWAKWLHKELEHYRMPAIPLASQKEIYIIEVPAWNVTDTVFMPCVEGQIIELEKYNLKYETNFDLVYISNDGGKLFCSYHPDWIC